MNLVKNLIGTAFLLSPFFIFYAVEDFSWKTIIAKILIAVALFTVILLQFLIVIGLSKVLDILTPTPPQIISSLQVAYSSGIIFDDSPVTIAEQAAIDEIANSQSKTAIILFLTSRNKGTYVNFAYVEYNVALDLVQDALSKIGIPSTRQTAGMVAEEDNPFRHCTEIE